MTLVQRFERNTAGRDFCVGDVHGCFDLLEALLAQAA
ncbi:serine/threonine protein phosphatase, partial [Pseudomonas aeruginosa]|nr:serine/threonine protein phosphatase [Pseudomonas aeruginosa]